MKGLYVHGVGAVSPAGWGVPALSAALARGEPLALEPLARPGWEKPLTVRPVPAPAARPAWQGHSRLRRASPISHYSVAAALEAVGVGRESAAGGAVRERLGVVVCVLSGSVNYTHRFYEETLRDPTTASPLLFPETVFNAPASHVAACLGTVGLNDTLVGDDGAFLAGLALAAHWLDTEQVEGCVVIGAEEMDWLVADAVRLFHRRLVHSAGAGAVYLRTDPPPGGGVSLERVTGAHTFAAGTSRAVAAGRMRTELPGSGVGELLCESRRGVRRLDAAEVAVWSDWRGARLAPRVVLGEGFNAASAWQCVAACEAMRGGRYAAANVSVVGLNQQALGARWVAGPGAERGGA
ncbi:MAG: hypothetical protein FJ387_11415 [Verrucomicrobia bacterium]|nr:hypothetical protein [Verrucomicrobiota bacterium]